MSRNNPHAPLITTAAVRVTVRGNAKGCAVENVFDYIADAGVVLTTGILSDIAAKWVLNNMASYAGCFTADWAASAVYAADISGGMIPTQFANDSTAGSVAGDAYPSYVSAIMSKYGNLKGQHGRGRNYFGPVPLSFVTPATDPDILNAAGLAAYGTFRTNQLTSLFAGGVHWVWSITERPVAPATLVTRGINVVTAPLDQHLGTTRRRIFNRGI